MKLWIRKAIVALVAIATLGLYTPVSLLEVDAENGKAKVSEANAYKEQNQHASLVEEKTEQTSIHTIATEEIDERTFFIHEMMEKAKDTTVTKFGPRIAKQVEDEFHTAILPTIEQVIEGLVNDAGEEYIYYGISESPSKGYGERIFHVYDYRTKEDIARFHVRRDNRPLEGHYFNFHYHLKADDFKEHYEIGEIYWDKNTPPKWMA